MIPPFVTLKSSGKVRLLAESTEMIKLYIQGMTKFYIHKVGESLFEGLHTHHRGGAGRKQQNDVKGFRSSSY